jgi:hypothetical protein
MRTRPAIKGHCIAISILCCVSAQAGMRMEIRFPPPHQPFFANDVQPSKLSDYVPLYEQSFPILRQSAPGFSSSSRDFRLNQLIEQQQQLNTNVERQRRILEKIRQRKLLEATRSQSR